MSKEKTPAEQARDRLKSIQNPDDDSESDKVVVVDFGNVRPVLEAAEDRDNVPVDASSPSFEEDDEYNEFGDIEDPSWWYVNCYIIDRAYGGPEEGGWWYDYGFPASIDEPDMKVAPCYGPFFSYKDAEAEMNKHMGAINEANRGRPPINSVLSKGRFILQIEPHSPERWPAEKPTYE